MRLPLLLLAAVSLLRADGGAVLLHQEAGPWIVTVFLSPAPPRAGSLDLSVLLQRTGSTDPVLDAPVQLRLTHGDSAILAPATHARAQNKMLYAATVPLDEPGDWRYSVTIGSQPSVTVSGSMAVAPREPKLEAYSGYLAFPFVCLAVFALHQRLRYARAAARDH